MQVFNPTELEDSIAGILLDKAAVNEPTEDTNVENPTEHNKEAVEDRASWDGSLESLDLNLPSSYHAEPVDFFNSPSALKLVAGGIMPVEPGAQPLSEEESEHSLFQAHLLSNCEDVRLTIGKVQEPRRKVIAVTVNDDSTSQDESIMDDTSYPSYLPTDHMPDSDSTITREAKEARKKVIAVTLEDDYISQDESIMDDTSFPSHLSTDMPDSDSTITIGPQTPQIGAFRLDQETPKRIPGKYSPIDTCATEAATRFEVGKLPAYRIVHLAHLFSQIRGGVHVPFDCSFANMEFIKEVKIRTRSIASTQLMFQCRHCNIVKHYDLQPRDEDIDVKLVNGVISAGGDMIPELTAMEEALESMEGRSWKRCVVGGVERRIDLRVLEPYKRVLSHGGYLSQGSRNAILVFSACFLPDRSRIDYDYVMNNLFMYVISTLDQLVTDDYVLVYLHGGAAPSVMPKFSWLKECYRMIDRKLRKNLKGLFLVHPTFWLKTLYIMTKPFVSSKFSKKLFFINSLKELYKRVPLEKASIPERVVCFDVAKEGLKS